MSELCLPFEERIINVDGPRPASFLALNPRALVPVLIVDDEHVIIESAIICQFLADLANSRSVGGRQLCPPLAGTATPQIAENDEQEEGDEGQEKKKKKKKSLSATTITGALTRAQMSFFIDAYWTRFHTLLFGLFEAPAQQDEEHIIEEAVKRVVGEIEPLLVASYPRNNSTGGLFFGGNKDFTLVEVITGPFVVRAMALSRRGVYPPSLAQKVEREAPRFAAWARLVAERESVRAVFDENVIVKRSIAKRERMRKAAGLVWVV